MSLQLDLYDLCRKYLSDNTHWLPASESALILGLIRSRDYAQLAQLSSDSRVNIYNARSQRFYLQIEAFFKKCEDMRDESVTRPAAISAFERGERLCRITNKRLDYYYAHEGRLDPRLLLLINRAAQFIENALGDFDSFINDIPSLVKITGGATASLPRRKSVPVLKLMRTIDCAPGTVPYLNALANHYGLQGLSKFRMVPWNRVEFVTKNWKTDRTIACEPTGSLPFQLAFDSYTKRRLKKYGVDLSDQSGNQRHALRGSVTDDLCTIDLSMASDTVAYNTVSWLLPLPWFKYLCAHRSGHFHDSVDSCVRKYAKFSSMGNGATFALETLIFLSFVRAAGCHEGLVYGDDITIHRDKVGDLLKLLRFFGFVPNVDKSYLSGPFRESCGKHYYLGDEVTPFYVRTTASWNTPAACHNVNGLMPLAEHGSLWEYLRGFVNSNNLPCTPVSLDSMDGVHLHPYHAYQEKLIRRTRIKGKTCEGGSLSAKRLVLKDQSRNIFDSRALLLWHMRANPANAVDESQPLYLDKRILPNSTNYRGIIGSVREGTSTSSYSISTSKFAVRWMPWQMPRQGVPEALFSFSEFLSGKTTPDRN